MLIPGDPKPNAPAHLPSRESTKSYWLRNPTPFLQHHRTTPYLPPFAQVIIIGSGISGAFAARELLGDDSRGIVNSVLMLEAREACWGATGRNGGHCQPSLYSQKTDEVADFQLRNFHHLSSLVREQSITCDWEEMKGGGCHAYFSKQYFEEAKTSVAELQIRRPDLAAQVKVVTDKLELARLRIPNAVGAVVQAHAARLWPYKLVSWILESLIKKEKCRLNLQTGTPVLSLYPPSSTETSWTVMTCRGTVLATHVLLATNGYTSHLLPQLSNIIVPVRGQMSALVPPRAFLTQPLQHTYSFFGANGTSRGQDDYFAQRPISTDGQDCEDVRGQLMFGGGRQLARHQGVGVDNDDDLDKPVAKYLRTKLHEFMDTKEEGILDYYPYSYSYSSRQSGAESQLDDALSGWTGIMGFSCDGSPWVGAVPDSPGLWISAGFTGHGMPNAPLSAQYVARLILDALIFGSSSGHFDRSSSILSLHNNAVSRENIPSTYIISKERMDIGLSKIDDAAAGSSQIPRKKVGGETPKIQTLGKQDCESIIY